jgi:hypothetical protein
VTYDLNVAGAPQQFSLCVVRQRHHRCLADSAAAVLIIRQPAITHIVIAGLDPAIHP